MASAMRSSAMRAAARTLSRKAAPMAASTRATGALRMAQAPQQQTRAMGVFSTIKDSVQHKMEERNAIKQEEAYKQQVLDLAHADKFDLDSFYVQLKKNADASGMNGWRSMIPGVSSMNAVQQLKTFMAILDAMESEHRENPRLINGKVKRKIAEKSGHSPEEINNMLRNYEQLSALHLWLVKRVQRNLSLPETMDETQELVRQDPTGFPAKRFRPKQRRY